MKLLEILRGLLPLKKGASYMEQRIKGGVARPLSNSFGNIITAFPSKKSGVVVRGESLIELLCLLHFEICYLVTEFREQPPTVMIRRPNRKGYEYERKYTPDVVAKLINGAQLAVEVKPSSVIEADLLLQHPRFAKVDDRYEDPRAKEYFADIGVHHIVITELDFGREFYENTCLIAGYVGVTNPDRIITGEIDTILRATGISTLEQLALQIESHRETSAKEAEPLNRELMLECVNWMLVHGRLYGDLNGRSIRDISGFEVYGLRSLARAATRDRELCVTSNESIAELNLAEGAQITFAGKVYIVVSVAEKKAYLKNESDQIDSFAVNDLERYFRSGELNCSARDAETLTPFASADTKRQEVAVNRAEQLEWHDSGLRKIPVRTYQAWKRARKVGQLVYGCGLSGLLPKVRLGNTTPKTCSIAKSYLAEYLNQSYLGCSPTPESKWTFPVSPSRENHNKHQAWAHYQGLAIKEGLIPLSYDTFLRDLKAIDSYLKRLKKAGRKAAYQVANPFTGKWSGASHGLFAGHIVEIDHTKIDLEVIGENGQSLGRMWLTVAIDTYSRMIMGYHISFSPPSRVCLMMVVRDMVRRHGYLPLCISVDGGKEFHSTYFDKLVSRFRIHKRCRPPVRPRFGCIIERLIKTINLDLWHNLYGNTVLMVNPRQVSKEFIAKNRAIWGVSEILDVFEDYVDEYCQTLVHSSIGTTPKACHDASYANLLPIQKRQVRYDKSFRISTMLCPDSGLELTNRRSVIEINGGLYTHALLKQEIHRGVKFPVKWDPNDMRHIYFSHNGNWVEAWLVGGRFNALSYAEVKILSDLEKSKCLGKYKINLTRIFSKSTMVSGLKDQEELVKFRQAELDRERLSDEDSDSLDCPDEDLEYLVDVANLPSEPIRSDLFSD